MDYEDGRRPVFKAPTTLRQGNALAGTHWSAAHSSDIVDLQYSQTCPNPGLGLSFGEDYLPDSTWNLNIPPPLAWTSTTSSLRDGSIRDNLFPNDSFSKEWTLATTNGQNASPWLSWHQLDLSPPRLADVACASESWPCVDSPSYNLTAASDNILLLPTSRLLRDFKSSLTISTLKEDGRPQAHTSIKGLLDLIDDSRAVFGPENLHNYFL